MKKLLLVLSICLTNLCFSQIEEYKELDSKSLEKSIYNNRQNNLPKYSNIFSLLTFKIEGISNSSNISELSNTIKNSKEVIFTSFNPSNNLLQVMTNRSTSETSISEIKNIIYEKGLNINLFTETYYSK